VFGQCVLGQEVVNAMATVPMKGPGNPPSIPVEDILLEKLSIVRTGGEAEAFDWETVWADRAAAAERMAQEKEEGLRAEVAGLCEKLGVDCSQAVTTESGLLYVVREEGSGAQPLRGKTISAHYTGYLPDGTKFDSSVDRGQPFRTQIGMGRVIPGWDEAFLGMKAGEKRLLIIPSDLAYGAQGAGNGLIPPHATLVFDVELLDVLD
jgi:FKBP-type peptidyl-prolyl cis-trans isomerase